MLILISYGMYSILNMYQQKYYGSRTKVRWAMELKDKHVDYLFLGSSRMANMIAMQDFDRSMQSSSLNIATSGSSYGESYLLFQQYLKNGNTAKSLILSLDLFKGRHTKKDIEVLTPLVLKHFDFFPYYQQAHVRDVYADYTDSWHLYLWDYLPFSRYAEFNQYFKVDSALAYFTEHKQVAIPYNTTNGEQLITNHTFKGEKYAAPGIIYIGPRAEKYLLATLKLAKENNIQIILVSAPYYSMALFDRTYHTRYVHFLEEQYGARYIDFTASKTWQEARCFSDPIHTNDIGSRIYTQMLADSLSRK